MADSAQSAPLPGDLGGMLSGILSDPELLSRLSPIVDSLRTSMKEGAPTSEPPSKTSTEAPQAPEPPLSAIGGLLSDPTALSRLAGLAPLLAQGTGGASPPVSREAAQREALLHALAPFLSERRREVVESLLQFSRLGGLLGLLQSGR